MFGTRDLFYKAEKVHAYNAQQNAQQNPSLDPARNSHPMVEYLSRIYQQSKQLSQIIAYIWRWAEDTDNPGNCDTAKELKKYFDHPTLDSAGNLKNAANLKKLLKANPRNPKDSSPEARYLRAVFCAAAAPDSENPEEYSHYLFPMFDPLELGKDCDNPGLGYLFEVNVNSFHGFLSDPDSNTPNLFKFNIPYPPRPTIGEATITHDELEEWINKIKKDDEKKYFADNPYIPTTCS